MDVRSPTEQGKSFPPFLSTASPSEGAERSSHSASSWLLRASGSSKLSCHSGFRSRTFTELRCWKQNWES